VAFAGRFVPKKGVDVLLEAMTRVVVELPEARLLVAGDGPERGEIEAAVRRLGLSASVELLGHRPRHELDALLAGAWVQALPSRWEEPFGNAAAEAMMRGTAVVASATGGVTEFMEHGVTGFLVRPNDSAELSETLLGVLRDRALAEQLGANARVKALAELSEDRMVERFLALYEELVEASATRNG
jgi:glycosyltransferase involved in cell wall biosynthesis